MTQAKPIPLRKQQKNYTRQRLIQVSRELFVKNGTQATGIDDIARAAGTSRATVYTHFAGKQDIIRELLSEIWDQALIMSESFDALPDISEGSIRGWLVQIFQAWDTYAESTKVVLREMPSDVNAEYQARLEAHAEALVKNRKKWAHFTPEEAQRRGFLLLMQLHRSMSSHYYAGWSSDREALLNTLTDIWCATLQPHK
jgi:AcrR family transcriptional regulator